MHDDGSVIVHVGLLDGVDGFDARRLTLQEITFVGVYTYTMMDFQQTVTAMAEGKLGALDWFEERSLLEGPNAFSDLKTHWDLPVVNVLQTSPKHQAYLLP